MKITEDAKKYIESNFNNEIDGIIININNSCCVPGEDIRLAFGKIDKNYIIIDGIRIYCDKFTEKYIKNLIIDYKNNMIIFGDDDNE